MTGAMFRFGRGARREFDAQATRGLYGNLPPGNDVRAAADAVGKRELAEQLAGTTNRRSRAYKNARDYISRHIGGRRTRVNPEFERKIEDAVKSGRSDQIKSGGSLEVTVVADVKVSDKVWKRGRMRATLAGDNLRDYVNAVEHGNGKDAMAAFLDAYGLKPDEVNEIRDVHSVTYT